MSSPSPYPSGPVYSIKLPQVKSVVTYSLLGLTVFFYLLGIASSLFLGNNLVNGLFQKVNLAISAGQYWRLITPILVHYSPLHIAFNMYALYIFGPQLEKFYGHQRFLMLYLLSGFTGVVASFLLSRNISGGASGAIFGLVAAQGIFVYQNRDFFGSRARSILTNILFIIGVNLVMGFSLVFIDNWGHLGGMLGGAAFAWLGGPLLQVAGKPPLLDISDQRSTAQALRVFMVIFLAFAAAVAIKVFLPVN